MAGSNVPGPRSADSRHDPVPEGLLGRSFAFPGPIGRGARVAPEDVAGTEGRSATPQQRAEELVDRFAARAGGGAFTAISRKRVADGLRVRVWAPSAINQGTSSLCGPASLLFDVATRDPESYVKYVTALWETGHGRIGRIDVSPGTDLKAFDPGRNVEASDWIALASLRDSENWFFDYQEDSDALAGITLPGELEGWFKKAGYTEVVNDARAIVDKDEQCLRRADDLFRNGFRVCLFIHSNMLSPSTQGNGSATADHWVVQTGRVTFGATMIEGKPSTTVSLRIFTWGEGRRAVPQAGVLPLDAFLDNFYGFVAARY